MHSLLSVQNPESTIHSLKRYSHKKLNFNGAAVTANFMPSITEKKLLLSNPLLHSKLTMYQSAITAKYFCTPKQQSRCHPLFLSQSDTPPSPDLTTSVILQQKILKTGSRKSWNIVHCGLNMLGQTRCYTASASPPPCNSSRIGQVQTKKRVWFARS